MTVDTALNIEALGLLKSARRGLWEGLDKVIMCKATLLGDARGATQERTERGAQADRGRVKVGEGGWASTLLRSHQGLHMGCGFVDQ